MVWELYVLVISQNQPRRKRWAGEQAWTSGPLRAVTRPDLRLLTATPKRCTPQTWDSRVQYM